MADFFFRPLPEEAKVCSWSRPNGKHLVNSIISSERPCPTPPLGSTPRPRLADCRPLPCPWSHLSPVDFQVRCSRWLRVLLFPSLKAAQCQASGSQGDVQGNHVLCCAHHGRYTRHKVLRDALVMIAEAVGSVRRGLLFTLIPSHLPGP